MTIQTYKSNHKSEAVKIPLDRIKITETIHKRGELNNRGKQSTPLLIVRPTNSAGDKFALVMGWADYQRVRLANAKTVDCIITGVKRYKFAEILKKIDEDSKPAKVAVKDIKILPNFNRVSDNKIKIAEKFYRKYQKFNAPIIIDRENNLVDGYAKYLAAKVMSLNYVQVEYAKTEEDKNV